MQRESDLFHHEYDYRPNCTTQSYYQLIIKIRISGKRRIPRYEEGKFAYKVFTVSMVIETKVVID